MSAKKNSVADKIAQITERYVDLYAGGNAFLESVMMSVAAHAYGVKPKNRPVGSYLLAGGSGTGKSYAVKALSEAMLHSEDNMIYIDGAMYSHGHEVAKLTGSPPGYLGHKEGKPIFHRDALMMSRGNLPLFPVSIVLIDELDKADHKLHSFFLGALENGKLQLGDNTDVDVSECLFFFTTNAGYQEFDSKKKLGFSENTAALPDIRDVMAKKFSTPFVNRLDGVYLFKEYTREEKLKAIRIQVMRYIDSLDLTVIAEPEFTTDFFDVVLDTFENDKFGLRRVVREAIDIVKREVTLNLIRNGPGVKFSCLLSKFEVQEHYNRKNAAIRSSVAVC